MKFSTILALLPLALAAPAIDASSETDVPDTAVEAQGFTRRSDDAHEIFARARTCRINGSGRVNCRPTASTAEPANFYVQGGSSYRFRCAKRGECVTISGTTNCVWGQLEAERCWVNYYYTDSGCTLSSTGSC